MNETTITSRSNPWVQQWLRYQSKPAERKAAGVVWLEGEHLVVEALSRLSAQRYDIDALVLPDNESASSLLKQLTSQYALLLSAKVVWLGESVYKVLCTMGSLPSICAVLRLNAANTRPDFTAPAVVLDGVQDPGNIGTIIRLCAAFGMPQVLLSEGCASAWSAKALRAGQGAQLAVQMIEDVSLNSAYSAFKAAGTHIAATCLSQDSQPLNQAALHPRMVWVFGSEGQGISAATQAAANQLIHIPMQGGFESLNVGSAAAICLWQWQNCLPA